MQFHKNFKRPPFYGGSTRILETFSKVFILVQLSKTSYVNITAISVCVLCRWPMQKSCWNENASSTARNFSRGYLLYLKFSELEELCSYFTMMHNSRFWFFYIFQKQPPKASILSFFKNPLFPTRWLQKMNLSTFREIYVRFPKNVILQLFSKYYQSYIDLKVKSS